jgi:dynein heavy chain 2
MRSFLSNTGVISTILNFDARQVTPALRAKVNKVISQNASSFEQSVISNASRAAAPLAAWCIANLKYSEVLLKIEPLTSELDNLLQRLQQSQIRVQECEDQLN